METINTPKSLVVFLPNLEGGGAQHVHLNLAPAFIAAGYDVTFFLQQRAGELLGAVPPEVRIVSPQAGRTLACLFPLVRFLKANKPDILLSNLPHNNLIAIMAVRLARTKTQAIVCFHNTLSKEMGAQGITGWLCRWLLPKAHKIVAVSKGVTEDLASTVKLPSGSIATIYNPIITENFDIRMQAKAAHTWLQEGKPFILAAGRLVPQKDFATLIGAFAVIANEMDLRLIIFGEGPLRPELETMIETLALKNRILMPGYIENILPYLRQASAFVLSSRYEGFGNVLVEALACGTPVISTDCPHGPREILEEGNYGMLVPVDDVTAMAQAIRETLKSPHEKSRLQAYARHYSVARSAAAYLQLFSD